MTARPRGFIEAWHPRAEMWKLLYRVKHLLDEYVEQLPLTLRQIFYILVGRHAYEKTERTYERLCETLNKARRAKVIDMDAVRADGFTNEIPNFFGSANHFLDVVKESARLLRLDRQAGQARRLALRCEASGMVPQLQRIADPFGIVVHSSGGFDSLVALVCMANLVVQIERMRDGIRRVERICEISGMEGEIVSTRDIFTFQFQGENRDGLIEGTFEASRLRPDLAAKAAQYGLERQLLSSVGISAGPITVS